MPMINKIKQIFWLGLIAFPAHSATPPIPAGETWYVCQGYRGLKSHNVPQRLFSLDLIQEKASGNKACKPDLFEKAKGKTIVAPVNGTVAWFNTKYETMCLDFEDNGKKSFKIGHLIDNLKKGDVVIEGETVLGKLSPPSTKNGQYSHLHMQMYNQQGCHNDKLMPMGNIFGVDLSDDGTTINQHSKTALTVPLAPPTPRFSYIKQSGQACIQDNATGLIWERKLTLDQSDPRSSLKRFTAIDNPANKAPEPNAMAEYVDLINSQGLCGITTWRLPKRSELSSLLSYDSTTPSYTPPIFQNTRAYYYWTNNTYLADSNKYWNVNFQNGTSTASSAISSKHVRLVSGFQIGRTTKAHIRYYQDEVYQVNNDFLMTACNYGKDGVNCYRNGQQDKLTHQEALLVAENFQSGNLNAWRLPSVDELSVIVNLNQASTAINSKLVNSTKGKLWANIEGYYLLGKNGVLNKTNNRSETAWFYLVHDIPTLEE